jgi:DNA-binding transcriptional LysR family regulator
MKSINLSQIDLNLLVAFEALFEERSVTLAAQRLYLGQPAMSAALGRLRTLFGDKLLIRVGREMQPTSKAIAIAPGIFAALQQVRQTIQASQDFDPAADQRDFTIGSADYTSFVLLPKLLTHCQAIAPQVNFRMMEFEKDRVGELLEQGTIDLALGVFPKPARQSLCLPLFQDHFVGIARTHHPALRQTPLSMAAFTNLSHALVTIRGDATGVVDRLLAKHNLQRRIALTTPHLLVVPSIVASSDLVATIASRAARYFSTIDGIEMFELPLAMPSWTVSMMWSKLADRDAANCWLRQTIQAVCAQI